MKKYSVEDVKATEGGGSCKGCFGQIDRTCIVDIDRLVEDLGLKDCRKDDVVYLIQELESKGKIDE